MNEKEREEALGQYQTCRIAAFSAMGDPDDDLIAPTLSYSLQGFPAWPSREAWQIIRRSSSTLLVSHGLSDPYQDGSPSLGLEVAVESRDPMSNFNAVVNSIEFQIVFQGSFFAASMPTLRSYVEKHSDVTIELNNVPAPESFVSGTRTFPVLVSIGARGVPSSIPLPQGEAAVLVLTPLHAAELNQILNSDRATTIAKLRERLRDDGYDHFCDFTRPSLAE